MVKVTLEVSNRELDALEDLSVAWNLCGKHTAAHNASEEQYFKFTQNCKKCIKINREIRHKTLHLWSKLVTAYLNSKKKRR